MIAVLFLYCSQRVILTEHSRPFDTRVELMTLMMIPIINTVQQLMMFSVTPVFDESKSLLQLSIFVCLQMFPTELSLCTNHRHTVHTTVCLTVNMNPVVLPLNVM